PLSHIHASAVVQLTFFFYCSPPHPVLHSFPTRRSSDLQQIHAQDRQQDRRIEAPEQQHRDLMPPPEVARESRQKGDLDTAAARRSEEHTSELQSRSDLVCRLLLEKKKKNKIHKQPMK